MTDPLLHMHDDVSRAEITAACELIAKVLCERDLWKASWRAEVDGCIFKFKIEGYPKRGTPKDVARQKYLADLLAESEGLDP